MVQRGKMCDNKNNNRFSCGAVWVPDRKHLAWQKIIVNAKRDRPQSQRKRIRFCWHHYCSQSQQNREIHRILDLNRWPQIAACNYPSGLIVEWFAILATPSQGALVPLIYPISINIWFDGAL